MVALSTLSQQVLPQPKFGRSYVVNVQNARGDTIVINFANTPFTIEFDITRNNLGAVNVCKLRIYNLNADKRKSLYFNAFNQTVYRNLTFQAGYGTNLPVIFNGNISACWSVREGTNFITQIECYDGGYGSVNGDISVQWNAGDPQLVVITNALNQLKTVVKNKGGVLDVGYIGTFPGVMPRGGQYSGPASSFFFDTFGASFYVDLGKANVLGTTDYIPSVPAVISSADGLLQTPILEQSIASFEMLFEPTLAISNLVQIVSTTSTLFSQGLYKITGIKHRGIISPAVCGKAITIGTFLNIGAGTPATPGL